MSSFPKEAIRQIRGRCIVLRGNDIDTDRIIPARFLKCVNFNALGDQVFTDDRIELKGCHPFDIEINKGASILVVNDNFGCGSSREHAPQALMRWGIRAIIGESFAEIFYGNCLALGIPCATTAANIIHELQNSIENNWQQSYKLKVKEQVLITELRTWPLTISKGSVEMLATGQWDATSQLIANKSKLDSRKKALPYLNNFN